MNVIIRNSFLALTIVGLLSLAACKTADNSTDTPAPAVQSAAPMSDSMPPATDSGTMTPPVGTPAPTDTPTDDSAPPTP